MKKRKKLSYLRLWRKGGKNSLTLKEVARRAGVSYTSVWNLENSEEKVGLDIKRKVARALGADFIELFPSVEDEYQELIGEFVEYLQEHYAHSKKTGLALSIRDVWDMIKDKEVPFIYHHRFRTLMDICPNLDVESMVNVDQILQKMTPHELRDLYHSSTTAEEAVKHLNRVAKTLGLKAVEFKKRQTEQTVRLRFVQVKKIQAGQAKDD